MKEKKVDLLKIKITGVWMIEMILRGYPYPQWRTMDKAIEASLWDYIHDAFIRVTGHVPKSENPNWDWELLEFSPERRRIRVQQR